MPPQPKVTTLAVTAEGGVARLVSRPGPWRCRVTQSAGCSITVCLVPQEAMLLAGDWLELQVQVGEGVRLTIEELGATVAYAGRGGFAKIVVKAQLEAGAQLVWPAQPVVVCDGANVARSFDLRLALGSVALLRDSLVVGREGECGDGRLAHTMRATLDGYPLLAENLGLGSLHRLPGILGGARVLDQVTLLGALPPAEGDVMCLAGPGGIVRQLGTNAHQTNLSVRFTTWQATLRKPGQSTQP